MTAIVFGLHHAPIIWLIFISANETEYNRLALVGVDVWLKHALQRVDNELGQVEHGDEAVMF